MTRALRFYGASSNFSITIANTTKRYRGFFDSEKKINHFDFALVFSNSKKNGTYTYIKVTIPT